MPSGSTVASESLVRALMMLEETSLAALRGAAVGEVIAIEVAVISTTSSSTEEAAAAKFVTAAGVAGPAAAATGGECSIADDDDGSSAVLLAPTGGIVLFPWPRVVSAAAAAVGIFSTASAAVINGRFRRL